MVRKRSAVRARLEALLNVLLPRFLEKEKAFFIAICGSSSVVEHHLAKVGVAGSNPVFRSILSQRDIVKLIAPVAQLDRAFDYGSKG